MGKISVLVTLVVATIAATFVAAIHEDDAKEGPCFDIKQAIDPDETWVTSVKTWYYPLASKLDLYRSAHDLLQTDYADIPEISLYYKSCLKWGIDSNGFTLTGYDGKVRHLRTTPVGTGTVDFKSEWAQGMVGRAYTTLTDNSTFMFTAACFADNQMTWNVFATTKTIEDKNTLMQILKHAVSLGYKLKYATAIRYDYCNDQNENGNFTLPSQNVLTGIQSVLAQTGKVGDKASVCKECERMYSADTLNNAYLYKYKKNLQKCSRLCGKWNQ